VKKPLGATALLLGLPLVLFGATLASGSWAADPAHTVVQQDRAFHPGEVTINRGETLTFTNRDEFIHQIFVLGLFDSEEKNPGENLTESFPQSGSFEVRCHIHPKMRLVVHVH
jgi:plastocyanin